MKVGDEMKYDNTKSTKVYSKCGKEFYRKDLCECRTVKAINGDYFQLDGDYTLWFKISDFNEFHNKAQYEIY